MSERARDKTRQTDTCTFPGNKMNLVCSRSCSRRKVEISFGRHFDYNRRPGWAEQGIHCLRRAISGTGTAALLRVVLLSVPPRQGRLAQLLSSVSSLPWPELQSMSSHAQVLPSLIEVIFAASPSIYYLNIIINTSKIIRSVPLPGPALIDNRSASIV